MTQPAPRPLVTIGIPTYNRAASTLPWALRSALDQTYPNVEIIVSDNASSDGTEAFVATLQEPRLRYVRHAENMRANDNFNFCASQARGAYFLLLHDDDLIDPDFVEACMNAAGDDTSFGTIRTGVRVITDDGTVVHESTNRTNAASIGELALAWFRHQTAPYCCNTLCNTAALQAIGGFHSRHLLFQDVQTQFRLMARQGGVNVHDVKASFRRHGSNMGSAARVRDWCEDSLELLDTICGLAPEHAVQLRAEGLPFFCRFNLQYASRIKSPISRVMTYLTVARQCDYAVSPYRYAWENDAKPVLRSAKQLLTRRPFAAL